MQYVAAWNECRLTCLRWPRACARELSCTSAMVPTLLCVHGCVAVAATDEGPRLFTWGRSSAGRLGRTDEATDSPGIVSSVPNAAIVSLGQDHGACVSSDGVLRTWGSCQSGQLGTGDVKASGEVSVVEGVGTVTDVRFQRGTGQSACVAAAATHLLCRWRVGSTLPLASTTRARCTAGALLRQVNWATKLCSEWHSHNASPACPSLLSA